jgi:hypothetical protein
MPAGPTTDRASVTSSFTLVKGAMIDETYAVFAAWDWSRTKRQNLDELRRTNSIGAKSATWLRDVAKVVNRRFDPEGRDRPLVQLAQSHCELHVWKPLLLWHITRDEFLLRDFLLHWLYPRREDGTFRLRPDDLVPWLGGIEARGGVVEHAWSESTTHRVAVGLLKMATDFGLLRGSIAREFASYHLPEASFLYLLHAIRDQEGSPRKTLDSAEWRLFLLRPHEVEQELLHLHQYRKLDYQVAGSLVELTLPCATAPEYAQRMVA